MKIARIETFPVPPRWLFVRVETADGHVGWGECGVQTFRESVAAAVAQFSESLIGTDPRQHQRHWETARKSHFYRGGPVLVAAMSGLDIALWDIHAKSYSATITDLLGGPVRDRMPIYVWLGNSELMEEPATVIAQAETYLAEGVSAFKLTLPILPPAGYRPTIEHFAAIVGSVSNHFGDAISLAVDFHGRADPRQAMVAAAALSEFPLDYIEEPLRPDDLKALPHFIQRTRSGAPIAAGERAYESREILELLDSGVSVLNPDVANAGGISEMRRYCALARAFGATVAPHCAIGPIALAASISVGFASPEVAMQEYPILAKDPGSATRYLNDPGPFRWDRDGHLSPPRTPGLGIDVNETLVRESAGTGSTWAPQVSLHPDGSIADW